MQPPGAPADARVQQLELVVASLVGAVERLQSNMGSVVTVLEHVTGRETGGAVEARLGELVRPIETELQARDECVRRLTTRVDELSASLDSRDATISRLNALLRKKHDECLELRGALAADPPPERRPKPVPRRPPVYADDDSDESDDTIDSSDDYDPAHVSTEAQVWGGRGRKRPHLVGSKRLFK